MHFVTILKWDNMSRGHTAHWQATTTTNTTKNKENQIKSIKSNKSNQIKSIKSNKSNQINQIKQIKSNQSIKHKHNIHIYTSTNKNTKHLTSRPCWPKWIASPVKCSSLNHCSCVLGSKLPLAFWAQTSSWCWL